MRYVECPRDAWQGLPGVIPTEEKVRYVSRLLEAGFADLDLGSFVSARAVPQWADTEAMLEALERPVGVDFLCIVGNQRGMKRAVAARGVSSVGFPFSVNERFQQRNLGRSVAATWPLLEDLVRDAATHGLRLVAYVSMGFGNPYGDDWDPADTADMVRRLRQAGVRHIALADTVGTADAERVRVVLDEVLDVVQDVTDLGLHLHARPGAWRAPLEVALAAGVRWFEGALGGIGGCPFASDELVGNLPTEQVVPWLEQQGFEVRSSVTDLEALAADATALASRYA